MNETCGLCGARLIINYGRINGAFFCHSGLSPTCYEAAAQATVELTNADLAAIDRTVADD